MAEEKLDSEIEVKYFRFFDFHSNERFIMIFIALMEHRNN